MTTRDGDLPGRAPDEAVMEALRELLKETQAFLDVEVRAMLPNEHGNCHIDSGCAHGAFEAENFAKLDHAVFGIAAALSEPEARQPEAARPPSAPCAFCDEPATYRGRVSACDDHRQQALDWSGIPLATAARPPEPGAAPAGAPTGVYPHEAQVEAGMRAHRTEWGEDWNDPLTRVHWRKIVRAILAVPERSEAPE